MRLPISGTLISADGLNPVREAYLKTRILYPNGNISYPQHPRLPTLSTAADEGCGAHCMGSETGKSRDGSPALSPSSTVFGRLWLLRDELLGSQGYRGVDAHGSTHGNVGRY